MDRAPLITIGLPVRNGEQTLSHALDAVRSQTFEDFELIIADNASTDGTADICRGYASRDPRIQYHRHDENQGAARNFNFTFEQARGRYFKWMAHDDVIAPVYLERCLETFRVGPADLVLCFGRRRFLTHDGKLVPRNECRARIYEPRTSYDNLSFGQIVRLPGACFPTFVFGLARTDALASTRLIGAYPTADVVLAAELRLLGRFAEVPEELYFQRHHRPDPEWLRRRLKAGEAEWYDPANNGKCVLPAMRCFVEHLRGIGHVPAGVGAKTAACLAMSGYWPARVGRLARRGKFIKRLKEELAPQADPTPY